MMTKHPLFIGTYTRDGSKGIYSVLLDGENGRLSDLVVAAETASPSYLTLSPDRSRLYAVSESEAMAAAYAVAPDRAHLSPLQHVQSAGGRAPCHLVVDASNRTLLVANYHTGIVAALPINADGSLQPPATVIHHAGRGVDPQRQAAPHVHSVTLSPDNRFVLVCDLGLDRIFTYRLDAAAARLEPGDPPFVATPAGAGPRHFAFSRAGKHAFCITEMGSTILTYRYDADRGTLQQTDVQSTLPAGFHGDNTAAAVRVHPDGHWVYGSNRGADTIAVFAFDEPGGRLAPIQQVAAGGRGPRDFSLSPNGRWLVAAHQYSHTLTAFRVDPATGRLTPVPGSVEISTPVCVLFAD